MPIKGLTDNDRFPIIGDIRKGAPKPVNGNQPGKDLTYFRYVPVEGEEAAAAAFYSAYGDEPREVNVFLPFDDIDRNFDAWLEKHTASALQCRGDGENVVMWRDDSGTMQHTPKPCPGNCDGCKATGRLRVIIPELRRLASVVVHTTAVWDIHELSGNLTALLNTEGRLTGIPLVLKRRPRQISTPRGNGKRVRQTKWLLSIEAAPRYVDERLLAMEAEASPGGTPALPSGNEAEAAEPEEAEGEFYDYDEADAEIEVKLLQTAMDYTTAKGTRLGDCTPEQLNKLLDWATANEGGETAEIAAYVPVLLDYLEAVAAQDAPQEDLPF